MADDITLAQLIQAGYEVKAAPVGAWRNYDEQNPVPNYFDFDWFSSRHPDLYHQFALTTDALMNKLTTLLDLAGMNVVEVGAGTGRAAVLTAKRARSLVAVDVFKSVVLFGKERAHEAGLQNIFYLRGHRDQLPLPGNAFDALINSWALLNFSEAYRVLKPGGYLIQLGPVPGALCGELTAALAPVFPEIITEVAPDDLYQTTCSDVNVALQGSSWNGLAVIPPILLHDFTYASNYGSVDEAAAILGRLYGPAAKRYITGRRQSTLAWRLRIALVRVRK